MKTHTPVTNSFVRLVTKHPRTATNTVCSMLCLTFPFLKGQVQSDPGTIPPLMKSDCCVLPSGHVLLCSVEKRFHHTAEGYSQKFRQTLGHHIGPLSLLPVCPVGITEKWLSWNRHRCLKKRGDDGTKTLHKASSREQQVHPTAVRFVLHILHIYIHKIFPNIPVFI